MSTRARTAAGLTVAGATAVAVLVAGLWPDPTASTTSSPPSGTSLPSVPPSPASDTSPGGAVSADPSGPAPVPEPTAAPMDFDLSEEDVEAYPVWDQASRDQAAAAAAAAMAAFTRPSGDSNSEGSDPQAWWAALMPHLTPTARQTYALVDPAQVPPTQVTGPGVLVEPAAGATAFLATVHVPTDVGSYEVLLARTGRDAPWLAELITPPAELSGPVTAPPVATT